MKVYLNEISGLWQAITAMYMSKRSWTREKELDIIRCCFENYSMSGLRSDPAQPLTAEMEDYLSKLFKWAPKHITLGRFLDFAFTVEGLHRGAQDDFDSHAARFGNRIIRSSTRLASFETGEKSDWYLGKILTFDDAEALAGIHLPEKIALGNVMYVRSAGGYIREDLADVQDVKRGLYPLCIPSNFTVRCNCTEFAHIVKERDKNSHAHPELRQAVEEMKELLRNEIPYLTDEFWYSVKN